MELWLALTLIGIITTILVVSWVVCFKMLDSKVDIIESQYETIDTLNTDLSDNAEFIVAMKRRAQDMYDHMKNLDTIGAFEADDETGIFFIELKQMVTDINAYIQNDVDPLDVEAEIEELGKRMDKADERKRENFKRVFKRPDKKGGTA